jgi:formamidopyrimidine-DNA glycosylase
MFAKKFYYTGCFTLKCAKINGSEGYLNKQTKNFAWIVHCAPVKHISHIDNETKFLFIHLHTHESSWHSLTMHLRMSTKCQKITTSNMQMKFPTHKFCVQETVSKWMNLTQFSYFSNFSCRFLNPNYLFQFEL